QSRAARARRPARDNACRAPISRRPRARLSLDCVTVETVTRQERVGSGEVVGGFLQQVASSLQSCREVGPGVVYRVVAETQWRFFAPPDLSRSRSIEVALGRLKRKLSRLPHLGCLIWVVTI